ncbi:RICIN domain-containing protein [Actinokineospora sp. HUAS TT18]|uniref:RICIN domain-containing protein n=1 Tax=Actinokineospora sp. HUAS TT18 TaxID=3447451 RepID=UPI003F51B6E3
MFSHRARPRRRAVRILFATVIAVVLLGLVAVPTVGSGWLPWIDTADDTAGETTVSVQPVTTVPADEPGRGLVYRDLTAAPKGSRCVGGYEVTDRDTCTHGPDAAPAGLDVNKPVAPVAAPAPKPAVPAAAPEPVVPDAEIVTDEGAVTDEGGTAAMVEDTAPAAQVAAGPNGVVCEGDGRTGDRVQVLYIHGAGTPSRYSQYLSSFRLWAAGVDTIYNASAQQTNGVRHVRFVTNADCEVTVDEVEVPADSLTTFSKTMTALRELGFTRTDRKYMIFADAKVYCGIGTFAGDERPGAENRSNKGPSFGRTDSGCWGASVAAHELGHNLGAVNNSAEHSSKAGHCVDDYDLMCYKDSPDAQMVTNCPDRAQEDRLDCQHDDYYHTSPKAGSYLATHWNMADSAFLIRDGGGPAPNPTTTVTPSPTTTTSSRPPTTTTTKPSPTGTTSATPSPTKPTATTTSRPTSPSPTSTTGSKPPTTTSPVPPSDKELTVSDVTTTSVRLSWPVAAVGTRYGVVINGRVLGTTKATAVRVVGLRPATEYRAKIVVGDQQYTDEASVRTKAAEQPKGGWFRLTNALTGGSAELYGSQTADNTPLIARSSTGAANQSWELVAAGDGHQLRSKATGKCVAALGEVKPGAPLVQSECGSAAVTWTLTPSKDGGFSLTTGGLVVGLTKHRFCEGKLLTLQRPGDVRHQAWTAEPI